MKFRVTLTYTAEFDVNPEHYPEGASAEEMLAIDIEGAKMDPWLLTESDNTAVEVTGTIIKED